MNSCIGFWIDAFILLQDSCSEESLVLFLALAWILPSRSPSTTFFLSRMRFFFKIKCCMMILSFLCRLDGKDRSTTAPLIIILKWLKTLNVYTDRTSIGNNDDANDFVCTLFFKKTIPIRRDAPKLSSHKWSLEILNKKYGYSYMSYDLNGHLFPLLVYQRLNRTQKVQ